MDFVDSPLEPNENNHFHHLSEQINMSQPEKILIKPLCPGGNQAVQICLDPNCKVQHLKQKNGKRDKQSHDSLTNNSFLCSDLTCVNCYNYYKKENNKNSNKKNSIHSKCFIGDYQSLLESLREKKKQCQPLKQLVQNIFDNFIDYLSQLREKCLNDLETYGLSKNQKKLINLFQNQFYSQISSSLCFSVVKQLDHKLKLDAEFTMDKLKSYWKKEQKLIKDKFQPIYKMISQQVALIEIQSKIINTEKEKSDLIHMLQDHCQKKIQSLNFLYRASQNQFRVDKFHDNCDLKKHTITIIETQYKKKIGGYTPIQWDKKINDKKQKDPSNKSFLFSLTNNHKFTLKPNHEVAIIQYSQKGPTFGPGNSDIFVNNNSNNCENIGNIGHGYINPEYKYGDQKSWEQFSGAKSSTNFKIKQWQVFQIKWKQF